MLLVLTFIVGLCVGSFLNVVILRLKQGTSPLKGRSKCPQCAHTLYWYELVPVLSFALQKGKCTACHKKISIQYPLIELCTGILFVLAFMLSPVITLSPYHLITTLFFLCILIVTFVTDLRWNLIYDAVLWPGIIIAILSHLITLSPYHLINALLAALVGAGIFGIQYLLSHGRWVGSGDILLGLFLGLMLGWPSILALLYLSYVSGALIALLLISLGKKTMKDALPLGTFLAAVGILLLLVKP